MTYGHWGKACAWITRGPSAPRRWTHRDAPLCRRVGVHRQHPPARTAPGADPLGPTTFSPPPAPSRGPGRGGRHGRPSRRSPAGLVHQCGGFFGAELKRAGWDTIIITGASETPVPRHRGRRGLPPGRAPLGQGVARVPDPDHEELGHRLIRVARWHRRENRALVANIIHDLNRAAEHTGLGAVMGSKRLKATPYAARSSPRRRPRPRPGDRRWFRDLPGDSPVFSTLGTMRMVRVHQRSAPPTWNFQEGSSGVQAITAGPDGRDHPAPRHLYGCPVRCKWVVEVQKAPSRPSTAGPVRDDRRLWALCGVGDIRITARANQLCNAYGLDTIGTGVRRVAMECFERS